MLSVVRRSPKLAPLWVLTRYTRLFRKDLTLDGIAGKFPQMIFDIHRVDGFGFKVRLFRPVDTIMVRGMTGEPFMAVTPHAGDTVLDIGANLGAYTLRYSRLVGPRGKVHAFEPEPLTFRLLSFNIAFNHAGNATAFQEAVGDWNGTADFFISPTVTNHSMVDRDPRARRIQVPLTTIDTFQEEHVPPDLVKIDVEGFEMNVLKGAAGTLTSRRPRLQVEVHHPHSDGCDVCSYLDGFGYRLEVLTRPGSRLHWVLG